MSGVSREGAARLQQCYSIFAALQDTEKEIKGGQGTCNRGQCFQAQTDPSIWNNHLELVLVLVVVFVVWFGCGVFLGSFGGLFVCLFSGGVVLVVVWFFIFIFLFFFSSQKALAPSMPFIQLQLCSPGLSPLTGSLHLESSLSFFSLWSYKAEGRIMYGLIPYRGTLVWVKRSSSMLSFPACFWKIKS